MGYLGYAGQYPVVRTWTSNSTGLGDGESPEEPAGGSGREAYAA